MPFVHLYTADQQQAAIDAMAVREGAKPGDMPPSLGHFVGSRRRDQVQAGWASKSLEDRVGEVAVMIGGFVPGDVTVPAHVVTHGYEALCRTGQLSA
jgi:hypothetical protein